jgi:hypothetical protein
MSTVETPFPSNSPLISRGLSAIELALGAFIVIAHNVFHVVPNEVIVLSVLGLISIRVRDGSWSAMGFKRPASLEAPSSGRAGSGCATHPPRPIRDRTDYWLFLAQSCCAGISK